MIYDVLKDHTETEKIPDGAGGFADKTVLSLKAGEQFIPAETNYSTSKVNALVLGGVLKLVVPNKGKVEKALPVAPAFTPEQPPEPPPHADNAP